MHFVVRTFFFIAFIAPLYLFAVGDSAVASSPPPKTRYYNQYQFENADSVNLLDSPLDNFQNYLPFNHLGNSGLAFNDLYYYPGLSIDNFGFNYFKNNYSDYFFSPQKTKFYNTRVPYANVFYATGTKKEQVAKVLFSYNIKKNWNTTFEFNRIRSDGFYARQNTNNNAVNLSTNYKSLNNRYYLLAALIYNDAKNAENGGSLNTIPIGNVKLNTARRTTVQRSAFLKQYFNIGEKSTDSASHYQVNPTSRFVLTSYFENNILTYLDPSVDTLSHFYSDIYYDTTKTKDSAFNYKIDNEILWKRLDNSKHRGFKDMMGIAFSAKHQYIELKQKQSLFIFNNLIVGSELYNTYTNNKFWWNVSGRYVFSDYNKNNYMVVAQLKKAIKDSLNLIIVNAEQKLQSPDFMCNHYYANNFFWNNNFSPTTSTRLSASMILKKIRISFGADYTQIKNVVYFDQSALPAQYSGTIPVFHAFLMKDFTFFKWHLNNKINYQSVPDSSVIRLPGLVLEHSLFYESKMFKKVLDIQIGASVFYVSSYYANSYMPATAQFYLQNTALCGNYPAINFFINAKIKTVRIFLKIDHLNAGLLPKTDYVLTPNYPMNGRAVKFGFSWMFFD